jgi:two-component system sensor histidine kinase HydH
VTRSLAAAALKPVGLTRRVYLFRFVVLVVAIVVIAVGHYLTDAGLLGIRKHSLHSVEYLLNFLPILLGALWYGLRGGIATAVVVSILYLPSVIGPLGTSGVLTTTERALEVIVYGAVGIITGLLTDRENRRTRQLLRASEELQKSRYLASIGQMVSIVAHDVRNPLQSIQLNIDMLRMEPGGREGRAAAIGGIERSLALLDMLVRQLLEYSKPAELSLSPVSIRVLIDEALDVLKSRLNSISLHLHLEQPDREIRVDSAKFVRALINLFSNAIEAMPSGGDLKIHSRFLENEGRTELKLLIEDTGIGINEADLERIYEPFFTTKPNGTGLGILISKKIIEAHGGKLEITSKLHEGTTVEVQVPI